MSYVAKLASSRSELIYWVTGKDRNKTCWYYIMVNKAKLELFKARLKTDFIQLKDYGTILYSGWGEKPPESIKQRIKEQFA